MRILLVEDNPDDAELIEHELREALPDFVLRRVETERDFVQELSESPPDLILSDYDLPSYNGAMALATAKKKYADIPFILVTGAIGEDKAIEILTSGARDYVLKSRLQRLVPAVQRALAESEEQRARKKAEEKLRRAHKTLESRVKKRTAELTQEIMRSRKATEELRKSEELYRSLFNNMLNGFAYCRIILERGRPRDFVLLDVNRAFESLTGLKDVVGKKVSEVIPGIRESDAELIETYGRVALTGEPERFERYVEALQMWFSISVYSPEREYFVAVFDVITERKEAEEKLKQSEKRFRNYFEMPFMGMAVTSPDKGWLEVNDKLCSILGYSREELLKKTWVEMTHPDDVASDVEKFDQILSGQIDSYLLDKRFIRKDGTIIWTNLAVGCIRNPDNSVRQVSASILDITDRKRMEDELKINVEKLRKSFMEIVNVTTRLVETRDPYTAGHQHRVAQIAGSISREMNLPENEIEEIYLAASIHDIGKIAIPAEILNKPGRLTDMETMLVRTHPRAGYDILKTVNLPWELANITLQHHEKFDGSGYPLGLKGSEIHLGARILAVADSIEAISSHRPFRPGRGTESALKEVSQNKGKLYDPQVVEACLRLFQEKGFQVEWT